MSEIITIEEVFTEGDGTTITGTANDLDGTIIDITGATIELIYWFEGKPEQKLTGSITIATSGTFSAQFSDGIPDYGTMHYVWRITESSADGGDVFHSTHERVVKVRRKKTKV